MSLFQSIKEEAWKEMHVELKEFSKKIGGNEGWTRSRGLRQSGVAKEIKRVLLLGHRSAGPHSLTGEPLRGSLLSMALRMCGGRHTEVDASGASYVSWDWWMTHDTEGSEPLVTQCLRPLLPQFFCWFL